MIKPGNELNKDTLLEVLKHSPNAMAIHSGDGLVIDFVNDAMLRIWGKDSSVVGKPFAKALPELKSQPFIALMQKVWDTGEQYNAVDTEAHLDINGVSTSKFFDFEFEPVKGEDNKVLYILNTALDVTDRVNYKRMSEDREERGQRLNYDLTAINRGLVSDNEGLTTKNTAQAKANRELTISNDEYIALNEKLNNAITELNRMAAEREQLNEELAVANEEMTSLNEELAVSNEELSSLNEEYLATNENLVSLNIERDKLNEELQKKNDALESLNKDHQTANEQLQILNDRYLALNEQLNNTNAELNTVNEERQTLNEELTVTNEELQSLNEEYLTTNENLVSLNLEYDALNEELQQKNDALETLGKERQAVNEQLNSTNTELNRLNEERQTLNEELNVTNEELQSMNSEFEVLNEELTTTNDELHSLNDSYLELNDKISIALETANLAKNAANLGTFDLDIPNDKLDWDARCKELFGLSPDVKVTYSADFVNGLHKDDKKRILKAVADAYNFDLTKGEYDVEYRTVGIEDKKLRWVRAIGKVTFDRDRKPMRFIGTVIDITEQKEDDQRKNDFIGMVSHEMKTPLTSLNGYLQMMQLKAKKTEDTSFAGLLEKSVSQIKKMTGMINGFLNVSRFESGKIYIDKQEFDMAELVKDVEEESIATISSHKVIFAPVEETITVADKDKIGQVVNNFINNAVKYSPQGSTINIACVTENGLAKVSVTDEGMGIAATDISKLFDRYYRVEGNHMKSISGFGIGLYLCAEIIKRHGGQIGVDSKIGKGSTFWFTLPLK